MTAHRAIEIGSKVFADVAQVIGPEVTLKLCEHLGGTRIYIPRQMPQNHEIVLAVGASAASRIAEFYQGTYLAIPKAYSRRERALQLVREGQMSVREIALATDYTVNHLYDLISATKEADEQLSFPGFLDD